MDIQKIEALIKKGESHTLEFKSSGTQFKAAFETICAFLNADGGVVLIGVNDKGKIIGLSIADTTKQQIASEIGKIEPSAHVDVDYVDVDQDKTVIVLTASKSLHAPYTYDGRPYQREQSTTKKMSHSKHDQLVSKRQQLNFSWEATVAEEFSLEDLDEDVIFGFVRSGVDAGRLPERAMRQSIPEILKALNLMAKDGQLKRAAVALFAKNPFPDYPQCLLKMAHFRGINRNEFIDSDAAHGNIFDLLERGMLFVQRHLPVAAKIVPGKIQRVETPLIPFTVIREALTNALCHREYTSRGGSVALAMYDNRMEISNHGGLLPDNTVEKIKAGHSDPRNPLIAESLYLCKTIERWGRGIPGIIETCKEAQDPEPEFDSDPKEFKVIFKFPVSLRSLPLIVDSEIVEKLSPRQLKIIEILAAHDTCKMKDILTQLANPPAVSTLKDDLAFLKKSGLIDSSGHAKTAVWFLKT